MPAQREEIVSDPHPVHLQHLGPNIGQGLLQLRARRQVIFARLLADLECRQRLAVQLAVGIERQPLQPRPVQRHHVLRQFGPQTLLDALQRLAMVQRRRCGHQIPHQVLAIGALLHANRRVAQLRLFMQTRFDFPQLDAVTANFHLMVDAPHVFQHPVQATSGQVAGAV